jgi:hypothetical protein
VPAADCPSASTGDLNDQVPLCATVLERAQVPVPVIDQVKLKLVSSKSSSVGLKPIVMGVLRPASPHSGDVGLSGLYLPSRFFRVSVIDVGTGSLASSVLPRRIWMSSRA